MTTRATASPLAFSSILAIPAVVTLYRYATDALSYGEVIHETGDWSVRFLVLALLASPLRAILPRAHLSYWLMARRRALGVATFGYAALHLLVYLQRKADPGLILTEAGELGMLAGWLAFLVFLPLAITSNGASARALGRAWKRLHRLVHAGVALTLVHWLLVAFDLTEALIYTGIFAALESVRITRALRARRGAHSRVT